MTILNALILGIIQGVAEFLPISSSGHLSIAQNLLGFGMEGAGNANDLALGHDIALFHRTAGHVGIQGGVARAVAESKRPN